jgi:Asp-tRNA(Asn)/Glu-tRNA(Gln) amidotransferase A subunit family amidase
LNAIINLNEQVFLAEAEASLERHKSGKTLSEFDGIPITIKDESDVKGYRTSVGTNFINRGHIAENDSVVVARLRAKGFLIAGKSVRTNLYESVFENKHGRT